MKKWLLPLFAVLLALPTWWVLAQENASIEITGANANDLPTLTINASILDGSNRPILGLTPADFTLGGDLAGLATIVQVENITDDSLPFAVVLVIDTSTSMSGLPLEKAKEAASLFVQSIGDNDPVAILSFDSDVRLVQDYTTDKEVLLAAINGLYVQGRTALYDAAVAGAELAAQAPVSRRAVILLSDGAEYGGESINGRAAGLESSLQLGVPFYTIGLGYGTDRSYLEQLATGTNARNYESPEPSQLTEIYAELAALFRTQYILTLESTIPGDGTVYNFTLQANTPTGASNVAEGTVRAPIPVPLVSFAEGTFAEAFSIPTLVTPIIAADQEIASITATINGEAVEVVDGSITIDPSSLAPATYSLVVTATDVDGDSGSVEVSFETAPLPPTVSINGLPEGALTEPATITLDIDSQTAVSSIDYSMGDESTEVENQEFTLDPINYAPGDYELAINVSNEGGATATVTAPVTVAVVAPRNLRLEGVSGAITEATTLNIGADVQSGASISATNLTANGQVLENNLINPIDFPAGDLQLEATVLDSNGQSTTETLTVTIASVAPTVTIADVPSPVGESATVTVDIAAQTANVTATYSIDNGPEQPVENNEIVIDGAALGNGEHSLTITVTDENGQSSTSSADFVVTLPPTATPTANLTETAESEVNALATQNAQATAANATEMAQTVQAEVNASLNQTLDANATRVLQDEATRNVQATLDAAPTETATVEETEALVIPSETDTEVPTLAPSDTASPEPSATDTTEPTVVPSDTATSEPTATDTVEPTSTDTAEPTSTDTAAPTATDTAAPTDTATVELSSTPSPAATLTPIGEIIEVDSQTAPPVEGNLTVLLLVCGGGLLLLILLALVFFGRQRRGNSN